MNEKETVKNTLLELLYSIRNGDIDTYKQFTSESLTCFEPETQSQLLEGLPFHLFLVENLKINHPYHLELISPIIQILGDMAYCAYTLVQTIIQDNRPMISQANETRIFSKQDGSWKMVHFHRS